MVSIENFLMTGVISLTKVDNTSYLFNGQFNRLPIGEHVTFKIMEFGDMSSLIVEYPDYNSLGEIL